MKSNIEKIMNKYNISYYELSHNANIGLSTIYRLKNNQNISVESLLKIACVLDCDLDDLVEIDSETKNRIENRMFSKED